MASASPGTAWRAGVTLVPRSPAPPSKEDISNHYDWPTGVSTSRRVSAESGCALPVLTGKAEVLAAGLEDRRLHYFITTMVPNPRQPPRSRSETAGPVARMTTSAL